MSLSQRKLQGLIGRDGAVAKHLAVSCVLEPQLHGKLACPHHAGGGHDTLGVEHLEQLSEPVVQGPDKLMLFHSHIVKKDRAGGQRACPDLVNRRAGHPSALTVDHEHGNALGGLGDVFGFLRASDHQHFFSGVGGRDPDFAAIDAPSVTIFAGEGFKRERVRARIRFGQGHAEIDFAGNERGQKLLFHGVAAKHGDRHATKNRVDHEQLSERGACTAC